MPITVDPDDNSHDMGLLRLGDEPLVSNEFSYTVGGGNNVGTATNSNNPVRYKGSKNEFSWDANDVAYEYYDFLMEAKLKKTTFPITIFNFGPDGNYNHKGTLTSARIDEVSVSFGDEGMQLDVSGIALGYESA